MHMMRVRSRSPTARTYRNAIGSSDTVKIVRAERQPGDLAPCRAEAYAVLSRYGERRLGWRMDASEQELCALSGPEGAIRSRRMAAGLTQQQLAEMSGLSVRAIRDIERGITGQPRRSSTALLGSVLGLIAPDAGPAECGLGADAAVPRQLPPAIGGFTGRARELDRLNAILHRAEHAPQGTVAI